MKEEHKQLLQQIDEGNENRIYEFWSNQEMRWLDRIDAVSKDCALGNISEPQCRERVYFCWANIKQSRQVLVDLRAGAQAQIPEAVR